MENVLPSREVFCAIYHTKEKHDFTQLFMGEHQLQSVENAKYLCININGKLSWLRHISEMVCVVVWTLSDVNIY